MKDLPAVPYIQIVKQYALSKGLPFWTLKEIIIASHLYNEHAQRNN